MIQTKYRDSQILSAHWRAARRGDCSVEYWADWMVVQMVEQWADLWAVEWDVQKVEYSAVHSADWKGIRLAASLVDKWAVSKVEPWAWVI